jgi:S1-C subfamily serine protease
VDVARLFGGGQDCLHSRGCWRRGVPIASSIWAAADPLFQTKAQALPPHGVLLTMVAPGSAAARAGLRPRDVLLRYGDTDLAGPGDLAPALQISADADKVIPVHVWREGRQLSRPLFVRAGKLGVAFPAPGRDVLAACVAGVIAALLVLIL